MDPNALLSQLLITAEEVKKSVDAGTPIDDSLADELAQGFTDLNEWIVKGGFLPDAWQRQR